MATLGLTTGYTDYNIENGQNYYYVTTAVNDTGAESAFSNEAPAAVPSGVPQSATLTLTASPGSVSLSSLACSPTSLTSGAATVCTVTLSAAAPSRGAPVSLSSSNALLPVPGGAITVPAGSAAITFKASAGTISSNQNATLTASLSGVSKPANISLLAPAPPVTVSSLACTLTSLSSGATTTCTVSLSGTVATGGAVVSLSSNSTFLPVPSSSATVPGGSSFTTFTTVAGTIPSNQSAVLTASLNGIAATATISLVTSAAIAFVQVAAATPQAPTATVPIAYPGSQTAGDLNVVVVGWNDMTATVQSVKDSAGNAYNLAIGPTSGTALRQSVYYARNIVAGNNTVTVTFNQAAVAPDIRILEYRGVGTIDVVAGASGNSSTPNSGSATTTYANDLIFGVATVNTTVSAAGSGFASRIITSPDGDIAEDKVVTTTGSYSAAANLSSAGPWIMQMVAFSPAGLSPSVTSISSNGGPTTGGTSVTIAGTNFASGTTVTFGGTAATNVVVASSTSITATAPAHAAGTVTITVSVNGQSGSLPNAFTYTSTVAIGFAQVAAATPQSPTATVSVGYPGAQTAGDLNVVVVGWNDATATMKSVSDSAGNKYALVIGPTSGTALRQSIYYASNIVAGSNTVTVTFNQAAGAPDVRILEYRGVGKVDVVAGASGNSASANSGTAVITNANDLIFGAATVYTSVSGAGTGFTTRITTTPDGDIAEDKVVKTTGSYSAAAGLVSAGPWVMQMVAFK